MKRALVLAALLSSPLAAQANPLFQILTPTAGNVTFTGEGTANFNNSIGTNNSFNVGSNTNLGVNASASGTYDYNSSAEANLSLGTAGSAASNLQQTIGTATSAFNQSTILTAAVSAAQNAANSSTYGSSWSNDWAVSNQGDWNVGAEYQYDHESGYWGKEEGEAGWVYNAEYSQEVAVTSKSSWETGWKNQYSNAYESAIANTSASSIDENSTGQISANFSTIESGQSGATTSAAAFDASQSANVKYGWEYNPDNSDFSTEAEWEAAWKAEYSSAYANSLASAARTTTSDVTVSGIGVIADVKAGSSSLFNATVEKDPNSLSYNNGNGTASAGANLATASFATQSVSSNASAFMQAFGIDDSAPTAP